MAARKKKASTKTKRARKPPWKKPRPKGTKRTTLSAKSKASAKARARRKGRRYPSLVDNMNAAKRQKRGRRKAKS